jgi:hypothetical protein
VAPDPPDGDPSRPRRRRALIAGGVAAVVVAVGGIALSTSASRSAPSPSPAAAPSVPAARAGIDLPVGWRAGAAPVRVAGLDLREARYFVEPLTGVRAAVGRYPIASASLLPPALLDHLQLPPGPMSVVRLGGTLRSAYYGSLLSTGGPGVLDVYAVPTPADVLGIACVGTSPATLTSSCFRFAERVRLTGGAALAPTPTTALRTRGPVVLRELDAARGAARDALDDARTVPAQRAAVRRVVTAYRRADAAFAPLLPPGSTTTAEVFRHLRAAGRQFADVSRHLRLGEIRRAERAAGRARAEEARLQALIDRIFGQSS